MRVGYVVPMSVALVNGGVRTQANFTIRHLKSHGLEPVLISPWDPVDIHELDLVHVFGATVENVGIVNQIHAMGIPMALSPVFYSNRSATFIKNALRIEKLHAMISKGIRSDFMVKAELCEKTDLCLPNTTAEAKLIEGALSVSSKKIQVIPNGVESRFTESDPALFTDKYGIKDFVLFAGQAGAPRKNVIKLLEIADKVETQVVIIGSLSEDDYGQTCRILANEAGNVTLIGTLDHDSELLSSAYAACKVFVLPSQFETPGIAAMEAALAGANIVITEKGGTKDYFVNHTSYINPHSSESLLKGIKKELHKDRSEELKNHILKNFSWEKVAELTAKQYKELLK